MSNVAVIMAGLMSSLGLGWCFGRSIKTVRQFFDTL